jgi:hypothetical protein
MDPVGLGTSGFAVGPDVTVKFRSSWGEVALPITGLLWAVLTTKLYPLVNEPPTVADPLAPGAAKKSLPPVHAASSQMAT